MQGKGLFNPRKAFSFLGLDLENASFEKIYTNLSLGKIGNDQV